MRQRKSEVVMVVRVQLQLYLCASILAGVSGTAAARPQCDDTGHQLVDGNWITSKFCQEELAGKLAQERGSKYTAEDFHRNPAAMNEFCRTNFDIRLMNACMEYPK